jgi:hypothetical protein
MKTLQQTLVEELAPLASLGSDDGMEMAEHYVTSYFDPARSYQQNVEYISQIISEDQ